MRRREAVFAMLASAAAVCWPAHPARAADPSKPNVIFIMTDDQGAVDAGCYGSKDIQTPNIDALAKRGVRFTQFYAAAPVCSPSRAGFLTGKYPLHCGLVGNAASQRDEEGGLPAKEVTIAQMFKAAGYATGHLGKWHVGYTPQTMPNAKGFDYSFGHMGGCIDNYSHFFFWSGPNVHDLWLNGKEVHREGKFFPDMMVEESDRFLEANKDHPFFLYFAINVPHYPYQPDQKWRDYYEKLPVPRRLYAAWVSTMDDRVGRLLAKVDALGLRENTIIALQSDNGHSTEERAFFGGGSAGPYRGAKFSLFEGGIRLPAMISWPGKLPQGEVRGQVGHGCDWMPTVAELAGVKLLNDDIDGKSLVGVIKSGDAASPHEVLYFQVGRGAGAQWAVREGNWKLIGNAWDTTANDKGKDRIPLFLANLTEDVGEKKNLAEVSPEIVKRLKALHETWLNRVEGAK
jgi:arylsulfatase A